MTIPACSHNPASPCPVGCWDDVHVRALARELGRRLVALLTAGERWHSRFEPLVQAAYDYQEAIRDPRSERAWPVIGWDEQPCDPSGWCANANTDEMADFYYKLRGPVTARTVRLPGGAVRVEETPTFRLPAMKC